MKVGRRLNAGECKTAPPAISIYANVMKPLEIQEILLWSTIIALVVLTVVTGRYINRMLTYRAHRRALDELRRRALESQPVSETAMAPATANAEEAD